MPIQFKTQELKAKLDLSKEQLASRPQPTVDMNPLREEEPILDIDLPPILQYLQRIEDLMAKEDIPIATLKSACRTTMQELNKNSDSILELEPKDISKIVDAYKFLADKETQEILAPKKTTARKAAAPKFKVDETTKDIINMAKDMNKNEINLDFL